MSCRVRIGQMPYNNNYNYYYPFKEKFHLKILVYISTKTDPLYETDYWWIMRISQYRLQQCNNYAIGKWSFSTQQFWCSL
jgi:hypothetical protein